MSRMSMIIALVLALGLLSTAAAQTLTLANLRGTWRGHCLQYAADVTPDRAACIPYKNAPLRTAYNVTYDGSSVSSSYGTGAAAQLLQGTVRTLSKINTLTCATVQWQTFTRNVSYTVAITTVNGVRTYTEEGVAAMPSGDLSNVCTYKGPVRRLYCDAKHYNYICTAVQA